MTGYSQVLFKDDQLRLSVSLKTVNGRFADFKPHLPREYSPWESEIKKKIYQHIHRGTIDLYISRQVVDDVKSQDVAIKSSLAKKWVQAFGQLSRELSGKDIDSSIDLQTLVMQEGFISIKENHTPLKGEKKVFFEQLGKAIEACVKERGREGGALKKDVSGRLSQLKKISMKMQKMRKEANRLLQDKLRAKWQKMSLGESIDEQRVAQEVVIQVDKSDISEEISRLSEHISHMKKLLEKKEPVGKKLDFYSQELLREVNTVGSKSSLSSLTEQVVEAKALVEQIREQVQNIQ